MTMLLTFMGMGDINTLFKLSLGLAKFNFETRTATKTTSKEMKYPLHQTYTVFSLSNLLPTQLQIFVRPRDNPPLY